MSELPRPDAPGPPGPVVKPRGTQSKSKGFSTQEDVDKRAMERYQSMLQEQRQRRRAGQG